MSCLSWAGLGQLLVWLVVIVAVFAIIKLFLPWLFSQLGGPGTMLAQVLNIVLWAIGVIIVIYIVFELVACLLGSPPMRPFR